MRRWRRGRKRKRSNKVWARSKTPVSISSARPRSPPVPKSPLALPFQSRVIVTRTIMTDNSHANGFTTNGDVPNGVVALLETPADSPPTLVSSNITSDVKIDIDFQQESDARHEPLPVKHFDNNKLDRLDAASTIAQVASPVDPGP
jgi:hypothetical protein